MKTFKFKTQILIICCALIASCVSALETQIGLDGREYLIDGDNKYTWFQAWHECARRNRQLLTIDSIEKLNVINKLFEEERHDWLWLGANDEFNTSGNADRPFFWSATGKQFTYAKLVAIDPNGTNHCVLILTYTKTWFSFNCKAKRGFICEEKPKQLVESSNRNPYNASDVVQKFINEIDLKLQILLKDNMAQLNGKLENIKQMIKDTKYEVEKLTNITQTAVQKILNKQELSTNHEITKQGRDLSY